jgi:hypothetical protein
MMKFKVELPKEVQEMSDQTRNWAAGISAMTLVALGTAALAVVLAFFALAGSHHAR